jgi:hypothetical protein
MLFEEQNQTAPAPEIAPQVDSKRTKAETRRYASRAGSRILRSGCSRA